MRLQDAEFLYESRLFPEPEHTFTHALTHEVAYEGLLQHQRRILHGRVVQALEALGPDDAGRQVEHLAHHAFRGELWDKAVAYAREAGAKAATRGAHAAAVHFRQALAAIARLPQTREVLEQAIDVRSYLGATYAVLADFTHASECLYEAEALAQQLQDRRRTGRVAALMTQCLWLTGELDRAIESGRLALAVAEELGEFPLQVRTTLFLGWTNHLKGQYTAATELFRKTIASLPGELSRRTVGNLVLPAVGAGCCLAWSLAELGSFDEALAIAEEATRLAESSEPVYPYNPNLVYARFGTAAVHLSRGDLAGAIPLLEQALEICQRTEVVFAFPFIAAHLARGYALSGRRDRAVALLEQAVERSAAGVKVGLPLWTAWLAECYLAEGRIAEAAELAEQALARSRAHAEAGHEAWILRLLAEIAARSAPDDVPRASELYAQARARATELGMRPLVAHCHVGLGKILAGQGRHAAAAEHLDTAAAMYRAMKMGFWLSHAEAVKR